MLNKLYINKFYRKSTHSCCIAR